LLNDLSVDCTREMMMSGIFLRYSSWFNTRAATILRRVVFTRSSSIDRHG
jgi:hypothetical protein